MNLKMIAGVTLGVFNVGFLVLKGAANRHAKKRAMEMAVAGRTEEQAQNILKAKERCDIFRDLKNREEKDFDLKLKEWKNVNSFELRKKEIINGLDSSIEEFKDKIGYFDKLEEIDDEFDANLEAFKKSIDYESAKEKLEKVIEEAKSKFEKQQELCGSFDDISDTAVKLKHAAEEAMTTTINETKQKIKALETQLETETDKLTKVKTEKIRSLEEKVSKEKIRLDKKQDKDLEKLNRELDEATNDIRKKIQKARTSEENYALSSHEEDIRFLREQKTMDKEAANDILEATPNHERIAGYLREKKIPKAAAYIVGMIPVVAVQLLCLEYIGFLRNIIGAM